MAKTRGPFKVARRAVHEGGHAWFLSAVRAFRRSTKKRPRSELNSIPPERQGHISYFSFIRPGGVLEAEKKVTNAVILVF